MALQANDEHLEIKLARYRKLTAEALGKIEIKATRDSQDYSRALDFIKMARDYYSDAEFFEKKGLLLTALAAYSYSHAWLDAGIKAGFLDGKGDDRLFVLP